MVYRVELSDRASEQLDHYVQYLVVKLRNAQAGSSLLDDALDTSEALSYVAGSLPFCADPELKRRGIRKMRFTRHRYLWLYRIEGDTVQIVAMYHELQDYENLFRNEDA
jgi:plasmid stabilization system protein ParE